ncbi:hypothetical protein CBR_g8106 [Chara braunii]|uniref:Uncharacterized protein n=1 Tax=Chara braunii TaxID=69332 RepID=A0A388KL87_CHABU|nr:hypothetical protein CBR_g8106 [Chara braunii]|eukprot:GBG70806.1 hypothetical protein CBR_g8106 [Chara braunii]
MEGHSLEALTLGFGRDGISREQFLALARVGTQGTTHISRSGSLHSQGTFAGDSGGQRPITPAAIVVATATRADKTYVQPVQPRCVDPSNTVAGSLGRVLPLANLASAVVHGVASTGGKTREGGTREEARRKEETTERTPLVVDDDKEPLTKRKKRSRQEEDLDARSKLWTNGKTFSGTGPGRLIADVVHSCADYCCAIVNGDVGASALAGLIMPTNDIPCFRIKDPAQREPSLRRARKTENVAMRMIHGWIFGSPSRANGFARAESYVSVDYLMDLARAV